MAGLKEIRQRIISVNSTKQITSAMKMVSASKLRKAQIQILKLRPFTKKFNEILGNLGSDIDNVDDGKYSKERELKKILIVPISSNRGMCGSFNSNILKATSQLIENQFSNQYQQNNVYLACIGKKAFDYYNKRKYNVIENFSSIFDSLTYNNVDKIAKKLIELYLNKEYDKIIIVYNQFKNAAVQELKSEQFLPLKFDIPKGGEEKQTADFIFEPSQNEILSELLPRYLKMQFYKDILESNASEHGARLTAMHIATDNATEILKQLRLSYNKARQASITKELLEIVSGAEALKG